MTDKEKARERALRYIAHAERTEMQVRKKLADCEFDKETIDETVEYFKEIKYIDDSRYAEMYAREASEKYGPHTVKLKLLQRGISKELAESVSAQSGDNQRRSAAILIEKLKRKYDGLPEEKKKMRMYSALARAGFDWSEVKELLD